MQNEMKCIIAIYKYDANTGGYEQMIAGSLYVDINTSAKELFENETLLYDNINSLFIMVIETMEITAANEVSQGITNFYSITTNEKGTVEDITLISSNSLYDKDILIDAILKYEPNNSFTVTSTGDVRHSIIFAEGKFQWRESAKENLNNLSYTELKKLYEKIKK